jgi:hypothetical protein
MWLQILKSLRNAGLEDGVHIHAKRYCNHAEYFIFKTSSLFRTQLSLAQVLLNFYRPVCSKKEKKTVPLHAMEALGGRGV